MTIDPSRDRVRARPRVDTAAPAVILTGGTITMENADGGRRSSEAAAERLWAAIEARLGYRPVSIAWGNTPSSQFLPADVIDIAEGVRALQADPAVSGVVIVQGTDTIEETSFAWELLTDSLKPVIVTGSMRSIDDPAYDGVANVIDSLTCAESELLSDQGVVAVADGFIHAADDVTKHNSTSLGALSSPHTGPLGTTHDSVVDIRRLRSGVWRLPRRPTSAESFVPLITTGVGDVRPVVRALVAQGARGLVIAASGAGNTSSRLLDECLPLLRNDLPIVIASRCEEGCARALYGYPGGAGSWQTEGAILAGCLSAPKARMLLSLAIDAGLTRGEIQGLFGPSHEDTQPRTIDPVASSDTVRR